MKRLLTAAALLLSLTTSSHALTIPFEEISGYKPAANGYGIRYGYSIGFIDEALRIDVDVLLWGASAAQTLLDRWETGIESIWSTMDRFAVPILFDVEWVSSTDAYDHSVRVVDGPGRWNAGTFYTVGGSFWGDAYNEEVAAHEFGHWIGTFDEYISGALNPITRLTGTGGLMETLAGPTLLSYYEPFLDWYEDRIGDYETEDPVATPEPGTVLMLGLGLLVVAVRMKRQSA